MNQNKRKLLSILLTLAMLLGLMPGMSRAGFSWWLRSPGTIGNYYAAACVYDEGAGDDCQAQRS